MLLCEVEGDIRGLVDAIKVLLKQVDKVLKFKLRRFLW